MFPIVKTQFLSKMAFNIYYTPGEPKRIKIPNSILITSKTITVDKIRRHHLKALFLNKNISKDR